MPRRVSLPRIFAQYEGQVDYVQRVSAKEYSSTCPKCGGVVHEDRSWPDRCRWFDDEKPVGWCRRCASLFWPDAEKPGMSPEEFERWRKEQEAREEARKRSAERALAHLRSEALWSAYHEGMGQEGVRWWEGRGVPASWQAIWELGWRQDLRVPVGQGQWVDVQAASIPVFDEAGSLLNIKYRVADPPEGVGRYRYHLGGQRPQPMFLCNPGRPLDGHVYVCEGEIKAMVCFSRVADGDTLMVGLPGKNPGQSLVERLRAARRVTFIPDPGATKDVLDLARQIGIEKCWAVRPLDKIDDMILDANLDAEQVRRLLDDAWRLSVFASGRGGRR